MALLRRRPELLRRRAGIPKGQANVNRPCLSDLSDTPNTTLGTCRGVPDVTAMSGDNATSYARDFYDYQLGTNGAYQATPGWDYVSGFGTPVLTPAPEGPPAPRWGT